MAFRFDRIFKNTAEAETRGMLHLLGALPIDSPVVVTEARRELSLPSRFPDHLFKLTAPDESEWLHHLEFQLQLHGDEDDRMTEYAEFAWLGLHLPVRGTLVLPVERLAGGTVKNRVVKNLGGLRVEYEFDVVRLWEMKPEAVFALGRPWLLPLVPLMRSEPGDLAHAARALSADGNRTLAKMFTTLGGLRYDRNDLEELLRAMRLEDIIKPDWVRHSSIVIPVLDEVRAEGRVEGRVAGRVEGRVEGIQHLLAQLLRKRFPSLGLPASLTSCRDEPFLDALFDELLSATSVTEAEDALRRAGQTHLSKEPS